MRDDGVVWAGMADNLIPYQGFLNYDDRVATRMGGLEAVRSFSKVYLVPGMGHATPNGTANLNANPPVPSEQVMSSYTCN